MITKELIDRINYLSKKSREGTLTAEEKEEQQLLRQKYIQSFRERLKDTLDSIKYVEDEKPN